MTKTSAAMATRPSPERPTRERMAADIHRGLQLQPKRIASKYFYDARGSELFERICEQPEYYLTRVERELLDAQADSIAQAVGSRALVLEYGSGSGIKTRRLLGALRDPAAYVPVEISESALLASVVELRAQFPALEVLPLCADFSQPQRLPRSRQVPASVLIYFPGSTIGNFEAADARRLLRTMHGEMGEAGGALIGIDLKKDPQQIEAAYNDAAGVTAEFTLNLLHRLNRELGMDFDVAQFAHRARYNALAGRIETHLVSRRDQRVHLDGRRYEFAACEKMLVEYSCKYSLEDFDRLAGEAGLHMVQSWTDAGRQFAIVLLRRIADGSADAATDSA